MKKVNISSAAQFSWDIKEGNIPNNVHNTVSDYFFFDFFGFYSNIINNYI